MVSPNDNRQYRNHLLASVVSRQARFSTPLEYRVSFNALVKFSESEKLGRDGHTLEIGVVADSLKVASDEQKIDLVVVLFLETRDFSISGI